MFEYQRRIGMRDVDAAGVLFFARYLSLMHEAYEEMLHEQGISFKRQAEEHGIILPVVHVNIDYRAPVFVGDVATIRLRAAAVRRRMYTIEFKFVIQDKVAASGSVVHACVDCGTRRAVPLPEHLRAALDTCP